MTRMANVGALKNETRRNVDNSIDIEGLVTSMRQNLDNLPLLSPECCIYEVPKRLRKINEEAYTPLRVSIGPLHHGKEGLEPMEEHKWRYLQDFLKRSSKCLQEFVEFMEEKEQRVRQCYAKTISFSRDIFVKIILVDAAFIIELLLRKRFRYLITDNDHIFWRPWMIFDVNRDLILLENQLPFFVLEDLFNMANINVWVLFSTHVVTAPPFIDLTRNYFEKLVTQEGFPENIDSSKVKHFVDFQRSGLIPGEGSQLNERKKKVEFRLCATDLHEAGVEFKMVKNKNLLDIQFSAGVLEIPYIKITDGSECVLRNLLAFEQCYYRNRYISDYIAFLDRLINTSKDVDLLVRSRVLENWLSDSNDAANLFNKLGNEITINSNQFYFTELNKALNDYCESPWHKSKATLRHEYCNTPWRVLSIIVAFVILILTFIQAVCSIMSLAK